MESLATEDRGPAEGTSACVALSAAGVTVVIDFDDRRPPGIAYWGAEIPGLDERGVAALVAAAAPLSGVNEVDVPVRVSVVPEHATGWTGRPGLSGSRDGVAWSTRFRVTRATLDGEVVQGDVSSGSGALVVTLVDDEAALEMALTLALLPSGLFRVRAALTNLSDATYGVEGLVVAFPVPPDADELLDFAGRWGNERVPQRQAFGVGTHLRESRKGRTGADSAYVLHAGSRGFGFARGEVHAVHTAFSGNHVHYAERTFDGHRLLGGGEVLLPGEVRLGRGETYDGPWLYGAFGYGLDEVAHRFHTHLRSRPHPVSAQRPVTLNVWEAVYFDHDLQRLQALADRAAQVGVERFVLDDGWFGARRHDRAGLGDWVVSADVWPEGLHPLVDHVRSRGMEFGLWFEPEMVNLDSDIARAHPEWVMSARSDWPVSSRHQQVLNLGIPAAYDHVRDQILAVLDEYDIGYVKWDHNRDLVEAGDQSSGGRPGVHAQTHAFYRLLDEIRAAHPRLEIESCSSGGARIDLAVLERTDRVWVSDCIDPHERQHMLRWTGQLVPPELMGSHVASGRSHTTGRSHELSFRAGTALFGHLGIEWDLVAATPEELDELAQWVALYRRYRHVLAAGDVVRMDQHDPSLLLHGVVAPDRSEALLAMVTLGQVDASPGPRLRFRGLEATGTYRLRPLVVSPPAVLESPSWWGQPRTDDSANPSEGGFPGCELTGATLALAGVAAPVVQPDRVVVFHARRVT